MINVSLERYYFVLYDGVLTLEMSKLRLTRFAIKLFKFTLYKSTTIFQLLYFPFFCTMWAPFGLHNLYIKLLLLV